MISLLSDTSIRIPCIKCNSNVAKSMEWIKRQDFLSCDCGYSINLKTPQLLAEIAKDDLNYASFNWLD